MRNAGRLISLVVVVVLSGCVRQTFDPAAEEDKLLKRDQEWAEVASAGKDLDRIVSYWSDDAVVIPSGQPVVEGKAAIRKFVAASLDVPYFKIHWVSAKPVVFSPDGQMAYLRSDNETTVPGAGGAVVLHGRAVTVGAGRRTGSGDVSSTSGTTRRRPRTRSSAGARYLTQEIAS